MSNNIYSKIAINEVKQFRDMSRKGLSTIMRKLVSEWVRDKSKKGLITINIK